LAKALSRRRLCATELDVSGKYRIRVACGFDGQALRRVLDVLERR
jgi:hypothetical protein